MKQERIMLSTDGPNHNVLKIKPPLCFSMANADELVQKLDLILSETDGVATTDGSAETVCDKASHSSAASLVDQSAKPAARRILSLA